MRPAVPAIAETAAPGFDLTSWNALMGPAWLPSDVVARVGAALRAAGADGRTRECLLAAGAEPEVGGPAELEALLQRDRAAFGAVVRRAGLARRCPVKSARGGA